MAGEIMEQIIQIQNVKKKYDKRTVVDVQELCFAEDRVYFILGENGAGKSTLLKMIADIIQPDGGKIQIARGCRIGYLPQNPYIFDLTVEKNLKLVKKEETGVLDCLKIVGLEALQYNKGNHLSGGEKQRLALLRIICNQHQILVLDEPTAALDIHGARLIEQAIRDYKEKYKCCVIMTSHDIAQAKRMADEVIFMSNGMVVDKGEFDHVFSGTGKTEANEFIQYYKITRRDYA